MSNKNFTPAISHGDLRKYLSYDAGTGEFRWLRTDRAHCRTVGKIAGCVGNDGYLFITVCRKFYTAHRLAWFYIHGKWPTEQIDHIDGDRLNNAISNLREATNLQNQRNAARRGY